MAAEETGWVDETSASLRDAGFKSKSASTIHCSQLPNYWCHPGLPESLPWYVFEQSFDLAMPR
jgi:hypothetical protein